MKKAIILTVNDNASGAWAGRAGTQLELVGPGHNHLHVIVRRPGERRTFGFPTRWLDGLDREEATRGKTGQLRLVEEAS